MSRPVVILFTGPYPGALVYWKIETEGCSMVIQVENLVKRYGDLVALDHFGLQIAEGEIFGLLGPNGSGKTTAINCILSLLKYDKGRVEIFGKPMSPDA